MTRSSHVPSLTAFVAFLAMFGLSLAAGADSHSPGFDRDKAMATAEKLRSQVKELLAGIDNPDKKLAHDLKQLEGHAGHLHAGLKEGNQKEPTKPVVKRIVALNKAVRKDTLGASGSVKTSLDAVNDTVVVLEGLYGIDVAAEPPPKPPAPTIQHADPCKETVRLVGVEFGFDSHELTAKSADVLDVAVEKLSQCKDIKVKVDGYTDSSGPEAYNLRLSQGRADAVKTYLAEKGIAEDRLTVHAFGEADPIASNETLAGRSENRRVELRPAGGG